MSDDLIILKYSDLETLLDRKFSEIRRTDRLTLSQLADEWQCTRQAIMKWVRRPERELPVHYVGSEPRFHRDEVERWSRDEARFRLSATQELEKVM